MMTVTTYGALFDRQKYPSNSSIPSMTEKKFRGAVQATARTLWYTSLPYLQTL